MRTVIPVLVLGCALLGPAAARAEPESLHWTKGAAGCTPRFGHTVTWSDRGKEFLIFGGQHQNGDVSEFYDDLWSYDPAKDAWEERKIEGTRPPKRAYHGAAWDPKGQALFVFGGCAAGFQAKDDFWAFDAARNAWSEVKPKGARPPARVGAQLFCDPKEHRLVLTGGIRVPDQNQNLEDVWTYDLDKGTWTEGKARWSGRWGAAGALVPDGGLVFLHGGFDGKLAPTEDTWLYDLAGGKWRKAGTGYRVTDAHAAAWDAGRKRVLVYGGSRGTIASDPKEDGLDSLAAYDPRSGKWSDVETTGEGPGPRAYHAMAADPEGKVLLLFGGTRNKFNSADHEAIAWVLPLKK